MLTIVFGFLSVAILVYVVFCYFLSRTIIYLDRQPVPKTPKDYGLKFENIDFKAADGVNLKGWLIPSNSSKLIVLTHVGGLTRYGSTTTYGIFSKLFNKEIEFLKIAQHLHNAGYSVLMFDFRNHGESDPSLNGGKAGIGLEEYQDVLAAMDFIRKDDKLKNFSVGFVSFCMGANSTIVAMSKEPEKFQNTKCLVAVQPISMQVFVRSYLKKRFSTLGSVLLFPLIKLFVNLQSKYALQEMSPAKFVQDLKVPIFYVQTRNDPWTELDDILGFYKNTPTEKEFFWLEKLNHRFQGYQYFGEHPEKMLQWLKKYM